MRIVDLGFGWAELISLKADSVMQITIIGFANFTGFLQESCENALEREVFDLVKF